MERRSFMKAGLAGTVGATAALAAPTVARAQSTITWKMTNAYGPNAPFYVVGPGSPTDMAKKLETMSGGRLKIQHFAAGELIPALEGFDAVAAGTVEANAANSYFWSGKVFAAQYFTTVPFGMSFQGHMAWLYHGGGLELWQEVYKPFNLVAFPMNNTGVQMTGWFRKEVTSVDDLKGLRMRIPGLAGKVYGQLGVDARLLPGGEIFPALERGVIDAAEFVGPFQDRRLGLQKAAKFYHTTGWHEPATTGELVIGAAAWEKLPADLKEMVKVASMACVLESLTWSEAVNGEALTELVEKDGVTAKPLPDAVIARLKEATYDTLATESAKDPLTKKVHDSYMGFKKKHDKWAKLSEGAFQSAALGS
ncbi:MULTISPECIES: TRAP transporter substrate-binding protein [Oceanibaculum]|uniref:Extracellular solute-binding protein n=2 Tax=Oceanibaculum indicum TaxID=526216 RepID=K2J2U1_9PROT|nr:MULTISPECIES: TRAP transporter substrate-binding protein DctP [Oceanibaculum]EKE69418.1 extracellular solute-binding protein [Oceanibaculum indicum P24]MCH2394123.1 TRAP transporter substrate-binding protein DctP [Oceanibaculum sp.]RKQ69914.1 TRAP-type mannitol/chloroaromatic compound transport system substrate-binding protein [Oceanibaculum indicum]